MVQTLPASTITVSGDVQTLPASTVYLSGAVQTLPPTTITVDGYVQTLPASTTTVYLSGNVQTLPASTITAVVTVTGQETCPSEATVYQTAYETLPTTVYETADASTVVVTETLEPDVVTQVQQETIYITAGRSYTNTYTGRTIQPSTVFQTVTITSPPQTIAQSAATVFVTDVYFSFSFGIDCDLDLSIGIYEVSALNPYHCDDTTANERISAVTSVITVTQTQLQSAPTQTETITSTSTTTFPAVTSLSTTTSLITLPPVTTIITSREFGTITSTETLDPDTVTLYLYTYCHRYQNKYTNGNRDGDHCQDYIDQDSHEYLGAHCTNHHYAANDCDSPHYGDITYDLDISTDNYRAKYSDVDVDI
ncbi:uncharacterized protein N0V89_005332 [Didymosphaeria variabile]|uniref:Uncharacterized protein n=1 Tax=Didymosphaeria variabile TaxID=1932322 RepID=A0A9W9CB41_9PLEO|nr:uncharacterized protein N0V89_005332 [Didymosphaeria variabile]KAJ4353602.1 hypothetical protein N0V89_005332 [Didymosphaeria variabile]